MKGKSKPVFGEFSSEDLIVEVPNGITSPFGSLPNLPKYGAGNRNSKDTRRDWGKGSNRSGE